MAQQPGQNQQQGKPQQPDGVDGAKDKSGALPIQEQDEQGTQPEEEEGGTDAQLEDDDKKEQREPQQTAGREKGDQSV
ncbi:MULTISPECIES: hypothetical protein [Cupriavidus]|uniref:Uncharacterized protein n=1 Tax=Cupriavidus pampae TaxID=659251 RepID=A0ABN7ZNJ2_9BURK|nr:hypothetical protein [Cupriavidus pampae]CAG9185607.1 hypothetical protein LMG32289_06008 [Cupriavidus pampae]